MLQNVGRASDLGSDHRNTGRHRLDQGDRSPFVPRRVDDDVQLG